MNRTMNSTRRWILAIGAIALILAIIIIVTQTGTIWRGHVYTVEEALNDRTSLNGQRITIRGHSLLIYQQSMVLCEPQRCGCNQTASRRLLLVSADIFAAGLQEAYDTERFIEVLMLDCKGDECTLNCTPINPKTTNELEVTGIFYYEPKSSLYPKLDSVELDLVREKINGKWQPVKTGTFTIQLRQP